MSLMALLCANADAQSGTQTILYKSSCCVSRSPQPVTITNEGNAEREITTVEWPSTENSWIKDTCWVKAPIISTNDYDSLFPSARDVIKLNPNMNLVVHNWMLAIENDETVLHCYFTMPSDIVTNIWLAMEETAIVDIETGVQYRIKRTEPECTRKHIGVKAKKDDILDFKIYFPKLAENTKTVSIYGVPMWYMRGEQLIKLTPKKTKLYNGYDDEPQIKSPTFVKKGKKYDKDNHETWEVYNNAHLIKPVKEGTMALWNTPEATYIAIAHEQNWMREYFGHSSETILIDNRGHRYKLKELRGLPTDQQFWIEGYSGDFIAFLMVFEPLPPSLTSFTFIEPDGEPFEMTLASWAGQILNDLKVEELRANQHLFEPIERVIANDSNPKFK